MIKLNVIRHGQTDWNKDWLIQGQTDNKLNRTGILQAEEKAQELKNEHFDVGISSDLIRARKTLEIILDKNVSQIKKYHVTKLIRERDFGELEGKKATPEIISLFRQDDAPYKYENNAKLLSRAEKFLKEIEENMQDKKVIVVAHSHFIKALVIKVTKNKEYWQEILPNLGNFEFTFKDSWEYKGMKK
jgi:uncharacterized phosphatase